TLYVTGLLQLQGVHRRHCHTDTTSLEKLEIHSINPQHQASLRVYRFLQQYDSAVEGGSWLFHCVLCNSSSCSKLHLLRHTHSPGHQKRELHYLQLVRGRSLEEGEGLAAIFSIRKCPSTETGGTIEEEGERRDSISPAKRSFSGLEETQSPLSPKHPRTDQRTTHQQATAKCPLCQDTLVYTHLRQHHTLTHSVVQDCVDKLMSVVNVCVCLCVCSSYLFISRSAVKLKELAFSVSSKQRVLI
uniref:C2H2-type domain-containing protein n=1 Tax=Hucho hucho TaxID=62062 RepID=A0A4W5QVQ1_9TELE